MEMMLRTKRISGKIEKILAAESFVLSAALSSRVNSTPFSQYALRALENAINALSAKTSFEIIERSSFSLEALNFTHRTRGERKREMESNKRCYRFLPLPPWL